MGRVIVAKKKIGTVTVNEYCNDENIQTLHDNGYDIVFEDTGEKVPQAQFMELTKPAVETADLLDLLKAKLMD